MDTMIPVIRYNNMPCFKTITNDILGKQFKFNTTVPFDLNPIVDCQQPNI